MSLGDYLRLLRARMGGVTPFEIEAETGLLPGLYRQMEQRYRAIGDEESIKVLADYFGVAFEDLHWRLEWSRKDLSRALLVAQREDLPLTLHLWHGESITGRVRWWDLGSVGLEIAGGPLIVAQRHAVECWEPRAPAALDASLETK